MAFEMKSEHRKENEDPWLLQPNTKLFCPDYIFFIEVRKNKCETIDMSNSVGKKGERPVTFNLWDTLGYILGITKHFLFFPV